VSGNQEIYVLNREGTGTVNLTNHPASDTEPYWSPDSTKIAFSSNRAGNNDVFVMNADGTAVVNLTNNPVAFDGSPSWSPDGSKIYFHSDRDNLGVAYDCYVMNANGTGVTRLTNAGSVVVFRSTPVT
jgi:Tol biopolymer transport system component